MTKRFNNNPTFDHQEYLGESGDLWNEVELRRTVALVADLLEGQETAYHKYTPAQFRHRLRTHWISERESMNRLMEKNIELKKNSAPTMNSDMAEYEDFEDPDDDTCPQCGWPDDCWDEQSSCIDDLCHGGPVPCMHGDTGTLPCGLCGH